MRAYCAFCDKSVRILQFLGHNCTYIVIFFYWNLKELQDPWWRIWSLNDSAIFGIRNTSQKKGRKFFCLPVPPIFNLWCLECLEIPTIVTKEGYYFFSLLYPPIFTSDDLNVWNSSNNAMVLTWLVLKLYPLYFFSWWNPMFINVQLQKFTNSVQNCTLV